MHFPNKVNLMVGISFSTNQLKSTTIQSINDILRWRMISLKISSMNQKIKMFLRDITRKLINQLIISQISTVIQLMNNPQRLAEILTTPRSAKEIMKRRDYCFQKLQDMKISSIIIIAIRAHMIISRNNIRPLLDTKILVYLRVLWIPYANKDTPRTTI